MGRVRTRNTIEPGRAMVSESHRIPSLLCESARASCGNLFRMRAERGRGSAVAPGDFKRRPRGILASRRRDDRDGEISGCGSADAGGASRIRSFWKNTCSRLPTMAPNSIWSGKDAGKALNSRESTWRIARLCELSNRRMRPQSRLAKSDVASEILARPESAGELRSRSSNRRWQVSR